MQVKKQVRTGQKTRNWIQIGKGVCQGYILSPCLFNLYAEYIIQNARLDEAQAGIKIAGRNINNLKYSGDKYAFYPYGRKQRGTRASLVAQMVKNVPAMRVIDFSQGWEGPLEESMAAHTTFLV